jgi:hypothetical protein
MADNLSLSEIIKNSSTMSMEELGSSLLDRQTQQKAVSRRNARKDQKMQKVLAVLLGGQAIFQNTLGNRLSELDDAKTIEKLGDENMISIANQTARIFSGLPADFLQADDAWEQYNNNKDYSDLFYSGISPIIADAYKKGVGEEAYNLAETGGQLSQILEERTKSVAKNFFEKIGDKPTLAQAFFTGAEDLFKDRSLSKDDIMKNVIGLNTSTLELIRAKNLAGKERDLRGQSGWLNVVPLFKDIGRRIFRSGESDAAPGFFSKRDPTSIDFLPATLKEAINNINFGEMITPDYSQAMHDFNAGINWLNVGLNNTVLNSTEAGGQIALALDRIIDKHQRAISANSLDDLRLGKSPNHMDLAAIRKLKDAMFDASPTETDRVGAKDLAIRFAGTIEAIRKSPKLKRQWITMMAKNKRLVEGTDDYNKFVSRLNAGDDLVKEVVLLSLAEKALTETYPGNKNLMQKETVRSKKGQEGWGWIPSRAFRKNYTYNWSDIDAILSPTLKINEDGFVATSPEHKGASEDTQTAEVLAAINAGNSSSDPEIRQVAEQVLEQTWHNPQDDDGLRGPSAKLQERFGTLLDANSALELGQLLYDSKTKSFFERVPLERTEDSVLSEMQARIKTLEEGGERDKYEEPSWASPYSARESIAEKGQLGSQVIGRSIKDFFTVTEEQKRQNALNEVNKILVAGKSRSPSLTSRDYFIQLGLPTKTGVVTLDHYQLVKEFLESPRTPMFGGGPVYTHWWDYEN